MQTHEARRGAGTNIADPAQADDIEARIRVLVQRYLYTRSPAIAQAVVRHLESLHLNPAFEGGNETRCDYLRMRRRWRWLAGIATTPTGS